MNHNERERVARALIGCFSVYGKDLSKETVLFMLDSLDEFDGDKIVSSIYEYSKKDKTGRPPTIASLIELMNPQTSIDALANDAASRITSAIINFGYIGGAGAKEYIGELGWLVVQRFGGWTYVCENHGSDLSVTTFYAQARDIAKSQMELAKRGVNNNPPAIPAPENKGLAQPIAALLKMKDMPK